QRDTSRQFMQRGSPTLAAPQLALCALLLWKPDHSISGVYCVLRAYRQVELSELEWLRKKISFMSANSIAGA
ncbi:MAG TPA: hypothetical protein VGR76_12395, partial [Candidatus Angelobacter sp.]|nr:hypothetical protein [Candidatus Angelobacter sp.]